MKPTTLARSLTPILFSLVAACGRRETPAPEPTPASSVPSANTASAPAAAALPPTTMAVRWTKAGSGLTDATDAIQSAIAKEKTEGRTLLVYVGASWCEPCQRFHHAVEGHQLDAAFPRVSFLEFDADHDGEALANAGYFSRLIPLIALPRPDGKASGKQIEGGIKGEGAVNDITPRLQSLLASGS